MRTNTTNSSNIHNNNRNNGFCCNHTYDIQRPVLPVCRPCPFFFTSWYFRLFSSVSRTLAEEALLFRRFVSSIRRLYGTDTVDGMYVERTKFSYLLPSNAYVRRRPPQVHSATQQHTQSRLSRGRTARYPRFSRPGTQSKSSQLESQQASIQKARACWATLPTCTALQKRPAAPIRLRAVSWQLRKRAEWYEWLVCTTSGVCGDFPCRFRRSATGARLLAWLSCFAIATSSTAPYAFLPFRRCNPSVRPCLA
ncbi:hypothetical protein Trydic_g14125 [Trypoxylus dichotomus]